MLEFEASNLPFESLFKKFALDMTVYNTPSLPSCRVISCNSISALNSWTQSCLFYASEGFPSKHECKNVFMVILLILIHGLLSTLHAERTMRCKIVSFTRQHFARANY